jgi:hypothetical protein
MSARLAVVLGATDAHAVAAVALGTPGLRRMPTEKGLGYSVSMWAFSG